VFLLETRPEGHKEGEGGGGLSPASLERAVPGKKKGKKGKGPLLLGKSCSSGSPRNSGRFPPFRPCSAYLSRPPEKKGEEREGKKTLEVGLLFSGGGKRGERGRKRRRPTVKEAS